MPGSDTCTKSRMQVTSPAGYRGLLRAPRIRPDVEPTPSTFPAAGNREMEFQKASDGEAKSDYLSLARRRCRRSRVTPGGQNRGSLDTEIEGGRENWRETFYLGSRSLLPSSTSIG